MTKANIKWDNLYNSQKRFKGLDLFQTLLLQTKSMHYFNLSRSFTVHEESLTAMRAQYLVHLIAQYSTV